MKGLRVFREKNNASAWYFSMLADLTCDAYLNYESMNDSDIPQSVLDKLNKILECEDVIRAHYDKVESFFYKNDLKAIFNKANVTYDDIAETAGVGVSTIKSILDLDQPFPDKEVRDKIIDYAMWLYDELDFPEEPSQETCSCCSRVERNSKKYDIEQDDLYKDIIICFTKLVNIAYGCNK